MKKKGQETGEAIIQDTGMSFFLKIILAVLLGWAVWRLVASLTS